MIYKVHIDIMFDVVVFGHTWCHRTRYSSMISNIIVLKMHFLDNLFHSLHLLYLYVSVNFAILHFIIHIYWKRLVSMKVMVIWSFEWNIIWQLLFHCVFNDISMFSITQMDILYHWLNLNIIINICVHVWHCFFNFYHISFNG